MVAIVETCGRWKRAQWESDAWFDDDDCECVPTHYLDLAIQEVTR